MHQTEMQRLSAEEGSEMDTEPYIRSTDGATMIAISPGVYVNESVWKLLGALR